MGCSILLLTSLVSTLGGLVFGYELGIISGGLLQLKAEFRLSCVQQEALVSSLLIGALLASVVGGCFIDRHGRRNSILLSNVLISIGSLVLVISSFPALVMGRITVGFAICMSSMSCCIFVSEMVTPDRRGFLVTLYEAGITAGILAAYTMNYVLSDTKGGWKWMFGLAVVPTLIQLVSIWFLPSGAEASLIQDCAQAERGLVTTTEEACDSKVGSGKDNKRMQYHSMYLFQRKDNMRTRTTIGLGLVLFQQFTGQPNVLFYASTIFHAVGFQSNESAVLASVGLGLVKVVATLISMVLSDRLGRRPLLISGCCAMALCLVTIGFLSGQSLMNTTTPCESQGVVTETTTLPHLTFGNESVFGTTLDEGHRPFDYNTLAATADVDRGGQRLLEPSPGSSPGAHTTVSNWVILVCMMAVVTAYSVGFGPMTWLLLSEIFPAAVRGRAFAFTNCFNWVANLLVTFTFLDVVNAIGLSGTFLLYGMTTMAAAVFFFYMLPETKGKSLAEIDKELRLNRFYHRAKCCHAIGRRSASLQYQRVHSQASGPA